MKRKKSNNLKPALLGLLLGLFVTGFILGMMSVKQELPPHAIGYNKDGGFIYKSDFIGPLNKYDTRAE